MQRIGGNDAALGYSSVKLIYTNRRLLSTFNIDLTSVISCFMLSITHRFLSMSSVNSIVIPTTSECRSPSGVLLISLLFRVRVPLLSPILLLLHVGSRSFKIIYFECIFFCLNFKKFNQI